MLLFGIERGRTAQESLNVLKFGPVSEYFKQPLLALLAEAFPDGSDFRDAMDSVTDKFFESSYGGEYLRLMARMLNCAEALGHGGKMVFVREEAVDNLKRLVSIKYPILELNLWNDLVKYVTLIYEEIESGKLVSSEDLVSRKTFNQWRIASKQLAEFNQRLVDQSRLLARLTQVDGALVLTTNSKCSVSAA